jgi:uncharacterized protein YggE
VGGESHFVGYTAEVTFQIILRDLDRLEEILSGLVDAGIDGLGSVTMQTSRLKEIRSLARQKAVSAAREKAEIYCQAAGVTLGPVIHIEDVDPDRISERLSHSKIGPSISPETDDDPVRAFDPGEIAVYGAVIVAYEIGR